MKELILQLRAEGKSYNEIVAELGCSKGTVSYHCGAGQKEKSAARLKTQRNKNTLIGKLQRFRKIKVSQKVKTYDFQRNRTLSGGYETGAISGFSRKELFEKLSENPICYLTGRFIDLNKPSTYSFDHIIPSSRGGGNNLKNLGLTCTDANMAKHKLTVEEFVDLCKDVLIHNGYSVKRLNTSSKSK